jgi:hypothetical protein
LLRQHLQLHGFKAANESTRQSPCVYPNAARYAHQAAQGKGDQIALLPLPLAQQLHSVPALPILVMLSKAMHTSNSLFDWLVTE